MENTSLLSAVYHYNPATRFLWLVHLIMMRVRLNRIWILCFNTKLKILQTISSLSSGSLDIVQNKSLPEIFWPFSPMVSELFLQKYWLIFLPNGRQIMWQKFSTPSLSLLSLHRVQIVPKIAGDFQRVAIYAVASVEVGRVVKGSRSGQKTI